MIDVVPRSVLGSLRPRKARDTANKWLYITESHIMQMGFQNQAADGAGMKRKAYLEAEL